jgi:hypothetical protein
MKIEFPLLRQCIIVGILFFSGTVIGFSQNNCEDITLAVDIEKKDVECYGGNTGEIQIDVSGGNGPYEFSLDDGNSFSTQNRFLELSAGKYLVYVRDALHCQDAHEIEIAEPVYSEIDLGPDLQTQSGMEVTFDAGADYEEYIWSNGAIERKVTFSWEVDKATTETIHVEVYDKNGCHITSNIVSVEILPRKKEENVNNSDPE